MKEAVSKVEWFENSDDQLIDRERSGTKATKAHSDHRVVKIPVSIMEEYKHADLERRMHMWYMFRGLRNEFDEIDRML